MILGMTFLKYFSNEEFSNILDSAILLSLTNNGYFLISIINQIHVLYFNEGESKHEIYFTAFFADTEHEIKPVTSGYRLVLVYMLCCTDDNFYIQSYRKSNRIRSTSFED